MSPQILPHGRVTSFLFRAVVVNPGVTGLRVVTFLCVVWHSLGEGSLSSLASGTFSDHEQVLYFCCLIRELPATGGHWALEEEENFWCYLILIRSDCHA